MQVAKDFFFKTYTKETLVKPLSVLGADLLMLYGTSIGIGSLTKRTDTGVIKF